jgi:hypothetical protein
MIAILDFQPGFLETRCSYIREEGMLVKWKESRQDVCYHCDAILWVRAGCHVGSRL